MWQKLLSNFLKVSLIGFLLSIPLAQRISDVFLILFLITVIFTKRQIPQVGRSPKGLIFLAIFVVAIGASLFYGPAHIAVFIRFLMAILAATAIYKALSVEAVKPSFIMAILVIAAIFQTIIGVGQFMLQSDLGLSFLGESSLSPTLAGVAKVDIDGGKFLRAYGTLPHPNVLAGFLIVGLLAAYFFWLRRASEWKIFSSFRNLLSDLFFGSAIFIILLGILFSFSRSAWLITLAISIIFIFYSLFFRIRVIQSTRLLILLIAILGIFFWQFKDYILPRATFSLEESAIAARFDYNRIGWDLIKNHPLGVGLGNQVFYSESAGLYQKYGLNQPWEKQPIHNFYILMAAEISIFGAAAFLLFLARNMFSYKGGIASFMLGALLIFGFTDHFLWDLQPGWLMLWLTIGLVLGLNKASSLAQN
ncbi:MAG: O-antigen ligase family protein [Candidatus Harrisonbacteria bacterium]|nr:O-antigen ligase family protein [Candidatus Harrisonbacteria bacterium]